jgi:diketogulonate reductase-like aldo/keto reductase
VYGNEEEVGDGIKQGLAGAAISREDLFVTTKVWCTNYLKVEESLRRSLENLGLDYVDLLLLHWPVALNANGNHLTFPTTPDGKPDVVLTVSHIDTYKKLEKLLATAQVKAIGVSNYSKKFLEELLSQVEVVPAVNQVENHPLLPQQDLWSIRRRRESIQQHIVPSEVQEARCSRTRVSPSWQKSWGPLRRRFCSATVSREAIPSSQSRLRHQESRQTRRS